MYDSHELYLESGTAAALPDSRVGSSVTTRSGSSRELRRSSRSMTRLPVNSPADIGRAVTAVVHNCPVLATAQPTASLIRDATGTSAATPIVLYHGGTDGGPGYRAADGRAASATYG